MAAQASVMLGELLQTPFGVDAAIFAIFGHELGGDETFPVQPALAIFLTAVPPPPGEKQPKVVLSAELVSAILSGAIRDDVSAPCGIRLSDGHVEHFLHPDKVSELLETLAEGGDGFVIRIYVPHDLVRAKINDLSADGEDLTAKNNGLKSKKKGNTTASVDSIS